MSSGRSSLVRTSYRAPCSENRPKDPKVSPGNDPQMSPQTVKSKMLGDQEMADSGKASMVNSKPQSADRYAVASDSHVDSNPDQIENPVAAQFPGRFGIKIKKENGKLALEELTEGKLTYEKELGLGTEADVFLYSVDKDKKFAVKQMVKMRGYHLRESHLRASPARGEVLSLSFDHEQLMATHAVLLTDNNNHYVLVENAHQAKPYSQYLIDSVVHEFLDGKNVHKALEEGDLTYCPQLAIGYGQKAGKGAGYLKQRKLVHRDIKLDNTIYLKQGEDYNFVIGDYGYARKLPAGKVTDTYLGSPLFISPEMVCQDEAVIEGIMNGTCNPASIKMSHTDRVDEWNFGVALMEAATGVIPAEYEGTSGLAGLEEVKKWGENIRKFANMSESDKSGVLLKLNSSLKSYPKLTEVIHGLTRLSEDRMPLHEANELLSHMKRPTLREIQTGQSEPDIHNAVDTQKGGTLFHETQDERSMVSASSAPVNPASPDGSG